MTTWVDVAKRYREIADEASDQADAIESFMRGEPVEYRSGSMTEWAPLDPYEDSEPVMSLALPKLGRHWQYRVVDGAGDTPEAGA